MPNPNNTTQPMEELDEILQDTSCDIDQIIVKNIFKKLQTGNKKKDDELWSVTCEGARLARIEVRETAKAKLTKLIALQETKAELYGRLHETIELFQHGAISSHRYSQRHAELTDQISQLNPNTDRKKVDV